MMVIARTIKNTGLSGSPQPEKRLLNYPLKV
jgi:hypothetical protein